MSHLDLVEPAPASRTKGYYGVPAIHRPHWKWLVIGYFFFGGIAGSAAAIGGLTRLFGAHRGKRVARAATYLSAAALAPCPPLLILDLGRPKRFLNMLRAFRPSSPMSVGTWGLTAFGIATTLLTALQIGEDRLRQSEPRRYPSGLRTAIVQTLAALGVILGLFVAGYTGVLLAATAVPLWSKRPRLLAPLFLSSAMTSGAAAVAAVVAIWEPDELAAEDGLRQLEAVTAVAEALFLTAWIFSLGTTARPIVEGSLGSVVRHGVVGVGIALPLGVAALSGWLPRRARRPITILTSALTLGGVFALRYAIVEGGRQSADDPQATFAMTG